MRTVLDALRDQNLGKDLPTDGQECNSIYSVVKTVMREDYQRLYLLPYMHADVGVSGMETSENVTRYTLLLPRRGYSIIQSKLLAGRGQK